jgi:hypothetical protein
MAVPERPPIGRRDELLSRLEQLGKTPQAAAPDGAATPDEVAQAAQRLVAGARDLEAFIDRWEQRLSNLEKGSGKEIAALVHRIDSKVYRLIGEARAAAVARWKYDGTVFLCGVALGTLLGFGVPYVWQREDLARDTHDVLAKILENTNERRAAETAAAKAAPSPKPGRSR